MADWQSKALTDFPELQYEITRNQGGPLGLWSDLYVALVDAYREIPINEDLIRRVYDYAGWCFRQLETGEPEGDLTSATAVSLIENLPLDQQVSSDLYRWMSLETFEGCKSLFRHHLSEEDYSRWHSDFVSRKAKFTAPSLL
jgi:hypothetical protein